MKRFYLFTLIAVFLVFINSLSAQKQQKSEIQLGAKVVPGINWLKTNAKGFSNDGASLKFSWGFLADFQFAEKYYFSTGFNVLTMGGKMNYPYIQKIGTDSIGNMHRSFSIKYIELPLSIKMKTRQFGYLTYFGQIGMGLGMRISAHSDDDFYLTGTSLAIKSTDNKIEDQINFLRLSMIISAGVEYSLGGSTSLFGAIGFNNGFTNIFDFKNNFPPYVDADAASNAIELTFGIIF